MSFAAEKMFDFILSDLLRWRGNSLQRAWIGASAVMASKLIFCGKAYVQIRISFNWSPELKL
jgi:hypothetical protein